MRCPVVNKYQDQVDELKLNKLSNGKICELMEQCDKKPQSVLEQSVEAQSDSSCTFCVYVVKKLQNILAQNSTEVDIETYLKNFCSLLPSKQQSSQCESAVKNYLPQLYDMLKSNIDPSVTCKMLSLCPKAQQEQQQSAATEIQMKNIKIRIFENDDLVVKTPLQKSVKFTQAAEEFSKSSGLACDLCSMVFEAVKHMLANKAEQKLIVNFIETHLCSRLGKFNETCDELVTEEATRIFNMIANSATSTLVCRSLNLCNKQQIPLIDERRASNNANCTICKVTMAQVKKKLMSNESQYQILDYVNKNLCAKVGKQKEMCKSLLDTYGPFLLELIARDINPSQVCTMLGFCTKAEANQVEDEIEEPLMAKSSELCVICEFTLKLLSNYINQNSSEPEIEKWLEYVCNTDMPKALRNECSQFVATYGPIIIPLLIQEVKPDQICKTIKACPSASILIKPVFTQTAELEKPSNGSCTICTFALNTITQYISLNATVPEVEKWLDYVCKTDMPKPIRSECSQFVNQYGPVIIPLLVKQINPDAICKLIGACAKGKEVEETMITMLQQPPVVKKTSKARQATCGFCKMVMEYAKSKMDIDSTEQIFKFTVENFCLVVPRRMRTECNSFMDTYGARAVEFLNNKVDPEVICEYLRACEKKESQEEESSEQAKEIEQYIIDKRSVPTNLKNGSLECSLCIYFAELVDGLLKQNKTDQEIVKELRQVCNLLPAQLNPQCVAFLNEYGPYVLQLIAADLDPATACQAIGLCPRQKHFDFRYKFLRNLY